MPSIEPTDLASELRRLAREARAREGAHIAGYEADLLDAMAAELAEARDVLDALGAPREADGEGLSAADRIRRLVSDRTEGPAR